MLYNIFRIIEILCFAVLLMTEVCLFISVQKLAKNGENKPSGVFLTPKKAKQERKRRAEAEKANERFETIMANIESYDGTDIGQREIK